MIITAIQKNTRQTARKVRYVANVVKKMSIEDAFKQLAVMERRSSLVVMKTLRQAVANAINNHGLALADLEIKNIVIDEAPTYKRWRAVSRGRAHTILKRSCHVKVELQTKEVKHPSGTNRDSEAASKAKAAPVKKVTPVKKAVKKTEAKAEKKAAPAKKAAPKKKAASTAKPAAKKTTKKKTTKKTTKK